MAFLFGGGKWGNLRRKGKGGQEQRKMRDVICLGWFVSFLSRLFPAYLLPNITRQGMHIQLSSKPPLPFALSNVQRAGSFCSLGLPEIVFQGVQIQPRYNKKMLSEGLLAQSAHNRRCEKPMVQLSSVLRKMQNQDYQDLIQWGFLTANELQLLPSTKFLARVYFDAAVSGPDGDLEPLPMFLAALCLAIKFNEMRSVSQRLSPEAIFGSAGICYCGDYYFGLEARILGALRFRLSYTTPYDYLDIFMVRFPFFPKMRQALPILIEFANVHASSCEYTSEELFFGAVLAAISLSRLTLSSFQSRVLSTSTDSWPRSTSIKHLILSAMEASSPASS